MNILPVGSRGPCNFVNEAIAARLDAISTTCRFLGIDIKRRVKIDSNDVRLIADQITLVRNSLSRIEAEVQHPDSRTRQVNPQRGGASVPGGIVDHADIGA